MEVIYESLENIVTKGENNGNQHFLLLQCFQCYHTIRIFTQSGLFMILRKTAFDNIVGKGENAGYQHFLLFQQCFLPFPNQISNFESLLLCRLQMLSIWSSPNICHLVKS